MNEENLHIKLVDKLVKKKFEYWKEEFIKIIEDWCHKNNAIPMKDLFEGIPKSQLKLAITDGGWVNVIKLMNFIKEEAGKELCVKQGGEQ